MSETTCPNCGASVPVAEDAPDESIDKQLSALIDAGWGSDAAAAAVVVQTLPDAHRARWAPVGRREAHRVQRGRDRRVEHATMSTEERWQHASRELRARLLRIEFSLGNGVRVAWGKATLAQFQQRRDMFARDRAGIDASDARVVHAMAMIQSTPGAMCLEDIEGSEQILVGLVDAASAEVDTLASGSAREPMTSEDAPEPAGV